KTCLDVSNPILIIVMWTAPLGCVYTHSQPGTFDAVGAVHPTFPRQRGAFPRSTDTENAQIQVLAERWVPACTGMAREFSVEINALLLDTSWITASKAGTPEPASGSGPGPPFPRGGEKKRCDMIGSCSLAGGVFAAQHRDRKIREQPRDQNPGATLEPDAGEHIAPAAGRQLYSGGAPIGGAVAVQPIDETRHRDEEALFAPAPRKRAEMIAAAARRLQRLVVAFGEQFRMGAAEGEQSAGHKQFRAP